MDWQKLINSAAYFVWTFLVEAGVAILAHNKIPEDQNTWILLIVGAFLAANGKLTSSTRLSPFGYTRLLTDAERRAVANLPLKPTL